MHKENGFSLIEFIVTMTLLLIVFAAAFQIFVPVARRSKVEGGNVQTQIEGIIGLELLRKDVVHAGSGIPWNLGTPRANYNEATEAGRTAFNDTDLDGSVVPAGDFPPRPMIVQNQIVTAGLGLNGSDYMVIKSALVGNPITIDGTAYQDNPAAIRWSYVRPDNPAGANPNGQIRVWNSVPDDLVANERTIVIMPASGTNSMVLVTDPGDPTVFSATLTSSPPQVPVVFRPSPATNVASYVFGMDSIANLRMPFNRADYYLSSTNVPTRCAPGTGVLVKTVLRQDNGQMGKEFPLMDCVAAFQVVLGIDSNVSDGIGQKNCLTNDFGSVPITGPPAGVTTPTPADTVRSAIKEVRLYILAQEGNFDMDYAFANFTSGSSILVGEPAPNNCDAPGSLITAPLSQSCSCVAGDATLGANLDMSTLPTSGIQSFAKFRWRVFKMVIKPEGIVTLSQPAS